MQLHEVIECRILIYELVTLSRLTDDSTNAGAGLRCICIKLQLEGRAAFCMHFRHSVQVAGSIAS